MSIFRMGGHCAALLACALALSLAPEAQAEDVEGSDDATFEIGASCAALAYMSTAQLKAFINAGYSDDFHSFCFPEEPSECSDYTPFLKSLGRLTTGDDGYHCSLQLN
jgi:hypothetical protein